MKYISIIIEKYFLKTKENFQESPLNIFLTVFCRFLYSTKSNINFDQKMKYIEILNQKTFENFLKIINNQEESKNILSKKIIIKNSSFIFFRFLLSNDSTDEDFNKFFKNIFHGDEMNYSFIAKFNSEDIIEFFNNVILACFIIIMMINIHYNNIFYYYFTYCRHI